MNKGFFLDRDGVVNEVKVIQGVTHPPSDLSELIIKPGIKELCLYLKDKGYRLIVVTNQPDVARKSQDRKRVEEINEAILRELPLDDVFVCYHDDADHCDCRKPKPGLLLEGASKYLLSMDKSYMLGDRWSDIIAGQQAGCKSILLQNAYSGFERCQPDFVVDSLEQVRSILEK